jgi:hypothetical protein
MLVRPAVLAASIFLAGNVLAAESASFAGCEYSVIQAGSKAVRFDSCATIARGEPGRAPQVMLAPLAFGQQLSEVEDGRGADPHARELANIAVSASIGNRDAVEIASSQLRKFGVTREEIQDALERTKLHGDPLGDTPFGQSRVGADANSVWVVSY